MCRKSIYFFNVKCINIVNYFSIGQNFFCAEKAFSDGGLQND
jgi:hypothetical protein